MKKALWLILSMLAGYGCAEDDPRPPRICAGGGEAATAPPTDVSLYVGDRLTIVTCFDDESIGTLSYTVLSTDELIVEATNADNVIDLYAKSVGEALVTVTATDEDGLSGNLVYFVNVPNRNPQPCEDLPDIEMYVFDQMEIPFCFFDEDGHDLTYTAASSAAVDVSVVDSTVLVTAVAVGTPTVTIRAEDTEEGIGTLSFVASIPNRNPTLCTELPTNGVVYLEGEVTWPVCAEDADGQPLIHEVEHGENIEARLSSDHSRVIVKGTARGTSWLVYRATDTEGASVESRSNIEVGSEVLVLFDEFSEEKEGWYNSLPQKEAEGVFEFFRQGVYEIEDGILRPTGIAVNPDPYSEDTNYYEDNWGGAEHTVDAENWQVEVRVRLEDFDAPAVIELSDSDSETGIWIYMGWGSDGFPWYKTGLLTINYDGTVPYPSYETVSFNDIYGRVPSGTWIEHRIELIGDELSYWSRNGNEPTARWRKAHTQTVAGDRFRTIDTIMLGGWRDNPALGEDDHPRAQYDWVRVTKIAK